MSGPQEPLDPALYESRAHIPIAVVTVVLSLATIAVGLRSYTRAVLLRQFGVDDATAILALVLAYGSGIMVASNTIYGAGRHIQVVDPTLLWKYFRVCRTLSFQILLLVLILALIRPFTYPSSFTTAL
jgi:hypothetical protein